MWKQLKYFIKDYSRAVGNKKVRGLYMWLSWGIIGIFSYRIERGLYLLCGSKYLHIRVLIYPLISIVKSLSHLDINLKADIGPGLLIMHNSCGIIISGRSIIGKNLTLVGGNIIGIRQDAKITDTISIRDNVNVGANSVIIGPLKVGNNVNCGASSCVINNIHDNCTVVGVPSRIVKK